MTAQTAGERQRSRLKAELAEAIRRERRAVLIVNTRSRRGARAYGEAKRLLRESGLTLDATYPVRDPSRLREVVAQAVAQGHRFIVVGGGDGTISSAVDAFAYKDVVFGLLPLGTANSFARTLSIPLDLAGAVGVLAGGKVVDIDLGRINDDYFANAASIGLPAAIARGMPHRLKKVLGRAGYLLVAAARLATFKGFRCTIEVEGEGTKVFESALELRIANGPYKGGILVAEEASVESRELVVHVVKGASRATIAKVWAKFAAGIRPGPSDLESFSAKTLVVDTEPRQYVSVDGEAVAQTPIRVSVGREALRIMVPQERDDLS
jgi:YegS/Rv2252/BmrU family lipid kinase